MKIGSAKTRRKHGTMSHVLIDLQILFLLSRVPSQSRVIPGPLAKQISPPVLARRASLQNSSSAPIAIVMATRNQMCSHELLRSYAPLTMPMTPSPFVIVVVVAITPAPCSTFTTFCMTSGSTPLVLSENSTALSHSRASSSV